MSAMSAAKVRTPEGLTIPPRSKVAAVLENLTDEGAKRFVGELLAALEDAKQEGDLAHVNRVVEAWFRTLLLRMDPEHERRWDEARSVISSRPQGHDLDHAQRLLGLDSE